MITPNKLRKPRWNFLDFTASYNQFTDGGSTAGTFDYVAQLPIGAVVGQPIFVDVQEKFIGDVSAALIVGESGDTDRYNTSTIDVFTAAGPVVAGIVSGIKQHTAATTVRLTVTSGTDFTLVTAGRVRVVIPYLECK